ncbi:hypothetical protein HG535_0E00950 [Zygotorulaspora mrakii]|uniref:RRM domain-containing protein n=1 Tax=Zygotorulaspora mrakii TaxID=42260 RepID=A0A7H9B2X7_ZYGMR|nr:uncharacterized protein HG535_0E00950 [Zygotorulaspora mrakii]QLG73011.1 hypothetical protein HG535_0E00950 [Zygotorulaspora mrakii]
MGKGQFGNNSLEVSTKQFNTNNMEASDDNLNSKNTITGSNDDNRYTTSSSDCSSPTLRTPTSGSSSPINPQLEQLASTNLLTVRVTFKVDRRKVHESRQLVLSGLETLIHHYKGYIVSEENVEPYEYLPDKERLQILQDNKDIYIYENGTTEFAKSYSDINLLSDRNHDLVIQVQFKRSNILMTVASEAQGYLDNQEALTENWSISTCEHALTQPGNLYIRGIPRDLNIDHLFPIFSKYGPISSLKIICDDFTGDSLGYGFLSYPLGSQASLCIHELNGKTFQDSMLFVNYHIERKERERIYRDTIKENNHDEKFKSIFIGNIPLHNENKKLITPDDILDLLKSKLAQEFSDLKILSYYFPKKNENEIGSNLREKENAFESENSNSDDSKANTSNNEPLSEKNKYKSYGFIKFTTYEQALKAIELFNNYKWNGSNLIVNKAEKNKFQNFHQRLYNEKLLSAGAGASRGRFNVFSYGNSPSGNPFGYYNNSGNMFFPYGQGSSQDVHPKSQRQDVDPFYGMSQRMSPNAYLNPFQIYATVPSTSNNAARLTNSMYPMNPYTTMAPSTQLALPIPAKDQQESNLYVKHLPLTWKDEDLYKFYGEYGEIISAKIITVGGSKNKESTDNLDYIENKQGKGNSSDSPTSSDEDSPREIALGASRGYGFVCFKNPLDASRAILDTDGFQLTPSHMLNASFAQKRAKSFANQGGQQGKSSSVSSPDSVTGSQPTTKRPGRSVSHPEHTPENFNPKYMNNTRHQGSGNAASRLYSNYLHDIGNWTPVSLMPNVRPGMAGMTFITPNTNAMKGSYVMQPGQTMSSSNDDQRGDFFS